MKNFINQNAEELAASESFQNWYFNRDDEAVEFWRKWVTENPDKAAEVEEAKSILSGLTFKTTEVSKRHIDKSWSQLIHGIQEAEAEVRVMSISPESQTKTKKTYGWSIAASIALLLTFAIIFRFYTKDKTHFYRTGFGETISVTLPDNSVATLNSNSTIRYDAEWTDSEDRSVWLDGEAYFSVVHTVTDQKFNVITSDDLVIEVLGTEFNVKRRNGRTSVVLKSGKVKLNIDKPNLPEELYMQPGELIEVADTSKSIVQRIVNTEVFTSWRCKKMVFENTPLEEVVQILEENYGLEVEISDDGLLDKQVSGSVPSNNTNLLIDGLSAAFDLDIVRIKNHVKIQSKEMRAKQK